MTSPDIDKSFSIGFILLYVLAAYLIGCLLIHLWEITLGRITRSCDEKSKLLWKNECLIEFNRMQNVLKRPGLYTTPDNLPRIAVMRDHIRHIAPQEVSRLLKLRAERK